MGFRYRKSVKLGPFRATVSKSGVSYSAGVKGARVTKRADGRVQTTLSVPKTGASYVSTSRSSHKPSTPPMPPARRPVAARPPKPPKPAKPAKPARPAKPPKPLAGIRSSIAPHPPWGWVSPRVFKGAFGAVSISEQGIQLNVRKRAVCISWPEVVAVDFLEPRFARMGHVHFVMAGDPRGLDVFARDKDPLTAVGKNPHAIEFPRGQRATYEELRRFIGG
jgi:hypothetical protein